MPTAPRPVALVTGGSSGIGRATSVHLASNGFDVAFQYGSNREGAEATKHAIEAAGGQASAFSFDLAEHDSTQAFWEAANAAARILQHEHQGFNAAVLNAAMDLRKEFHEYSATELTTLFQVNVIAPTLIMQGAQQNVESGGSIVVISSTAATKPLLSSVPYSMTKASINMLVAASSQLLLPHGIRVNGVSPGIVDTPLQTRERIALLQSSGAVGMPDDVAAVVLYLVSDASRWVNGQVIQATGGH